MEAKQSGSISGLALDEATCDTRMDQQRIVIDLLVCFG